MFLFPFIWALFASSVLAAFGYTESSAYWTINNGKNLVIKVSRTNGDIQSMVYNVRYTQLDDHGYQLLYNSCWLWSLQGKEYNGYSGKNTHVESGLGASTVTIQQFSTPANIIKVSVTYGTLKHCRFYLASSLISLRLADSSDRPFRSLRSG